MGWTLISTQQAEEDLLEIWSHLAADNPGAADHMIHGLAEAFEQVSDHPPIGRPAFEIRQGMRLLRYRAYMLNYRLDDDRHVAELVRVLHSARNWPALFE
ncbi:MAG: plasmid stabilization protein [Caulobacteraceae bacterium]|nr:plasmid stabilization protein [Caulobacteraceae bacterium]